MKSKGITVAILAAFLSLVPFFSFGSTVKLTFDNLPDTFGFGPETVVESGITIGGRPSIFGIPGLLHIDDSGSSYSNFVTFSAPYRFDVVSVDIFGLGQSLFLPGTGNNNDIPIPYDNVLFEGFSGGTLANSLTFSTGLSPVAFTLAFGDLFTNLELFSISSTFVSFVPGAFCVGFPCGHFNVDNVVLRETSISPVPLPSSGALLLGMFVILILGKWTIGRANKLV